MLLQTTPPLEHYQLVNVTRQPAVVVDDYQSASCLVSDVWPGSFIFCQPPDGPPPTTVVTFETPNKCPLLSGIYAGIDWGTSQWACQNFNWFGLPANNVSFSAFVQQRSFTMAIPGVLLALDASAGVAGHLTLTSDAGERLEADLPKGGPIRITTNWRQPARVITVDFTGKWLLAIGNITRTP